MAAKPVDMNVDVELEPLEAENEALRKANETLQKKNECLRTENESLQGENVSLRERVRTLERDLYSTSHPCLTDFGLMGLHGGMYWMSCCGLYHQINCAKTTQARTKCHCRARKDTYLLCGEVQEAHGKCVIYL